MSDVTIDVDTTDADAAIARLTEAIRGIAAAFRTAFEHIARALRTWWAGLRPFARWLARHSRGSYSSPLPMAIDGHAYTRRRRARTRRRRNT